MTSLVKPAKKKYSIQSEPDVGFSTDDFEMSTEGAHRVLPKGNQNLNSGQFYFESESVNKSAPYIPNAINKNNLGSFWGPKESGTPSPSNPTGE